MRGQLNCRYCWSRVRPLLFAEISSTITRVSNTTYRKNPKTSCLTSLLVSTKNQGGVSVSISLIYCLQESKKLILGQELATLRQKNAATCRPCFWCILLLLITCWHEIRKQQNVIKLPTAKRCFSLARNRVTKRLHSVRNTCNPILLKCIDARCSTKYIVMKLVCSSFRFWLLKG